MPRTNAKFERGFTLVEAVIVVVITGIVAGMVALFIRLPVQGYIDSEARAELAGTAQTALQRMSRDLRLALPNSIRVTTTGDNQYIEFLPTKTAGRHLAVEDSPPTGFSPSTGFILSFTNIPSKDQFTVVDPSPTKLEAIVPGDFIVVYNTGTGSTNAYQCAPPCNSSQVSGVSGNTITLAANRFVDLSGPASTSPGRGFQVVTSAVTYECNPNAGTVTRYWDYGIVAAQPSDGSATPLADGRHALLATGITDCSFSYAPAILSSATGLVDLSLKMRAAGSEQVTLLHQVYVDNTP